MFSFILAKISQLYDPTIVWFYCWLFIKSLLTLSFPIQADSSCTLMTYIENSCRERYQDGHQVNWHALKGLWCHASNIHHGTSHRVIAMYFHMPRLWVVCTLQQHTPAKRFGLWISCSVILQYVLSGVKRITFPIVEY